ncbi:MAG: 2OG-Fe(II) oxygenase [Pseudomonadota bacterium]
MSLEFFSIYENVLSAQTCEQIIDRFENSTDKHPGLVGDGSQHGGYDKNIKQTTELILNNRPEWQDVMELLFKSLQNQLPVYLQKWAHALKVELEPEDIRIQKYEPGGFFDWHSDNVGGALRRVITVIWYLNTVEEGGETEYVWQKARIKPVQGSLLLCPVGWTYFHRGAPPVSDNKYIIITQLNQKLGG